ncbi:hypothetical protein OG342_05055 [Streptomyces bobili]|uniref:hypothetical protein n=1 Tax=Streptomyces bobili TaxID=67280 RepID=UPI00225168BC|nr:hypothetical protein [Streptomyces bobili]MCX5522236.1 hypothetical protein [Streptomyces bobili]
MTTDQNPTAEADADAVANRAAQVITRMGADIRALTGERDRYRTAWRSARERAQAYGDGILRVVKDREQYQQWLKQAEERGVALERAMESTAADALRHRGCHRDLMAQCLRAERAEAEANELRRAAAVPVPPPADQTAGRGLRAVFTVTVETRKDGDYYFDHADLVRNVVPWLEGALEDRDDIRDVTVSEAPLSPDYEHPECGFHWHGRDGMDIPIRDGQPVCPRCELRRAEKLLAHRERRCQELREECLRRGKNVLARSLKIVALERQIDEVRSQLGTEILRAGQAETELRRVAAEEQPAETEAHPPEHTWAAELRDPLADEWAPGTRYTVRDRAVNHLTHARSLVPTWKDGTPTQRRLVRATTTYTVEAEHTPPAVGEQPETQEAPVLPCNYWTHTRTEHTPHRWEPQPGLDPVHCPGFGPE